MPGKGSRWSAPDDARTTLPILTELQLAVPVIVHGGY
jgi:hypothetical protein